MPDVPCCAARVRSLPLLPRRVALTCVRDPTATTASGELRGWLPGGGTGAATAAGADCRCCVAGGSSTCCCCCCSASSASSVPWSVTNTVSYSLPSSSSAAAADGLLLQGQPLLRLSCAAALRQERAKRCRRCLSAQPFVLRRDGSREWPAEPCSCAAMLRQLFHALGVSKANVRAAAWDAQLGELVRHPTCPITY